MSEWSTYSLSDFLLFSPRTYYRLFELYDAAMWPAQIVAVALGVAVLVLVLSRRDAAWLGRAVVAVLAAAWLWVAWAFHYERYATINWAATYFALAFAVEAVLLAWTGVVRDRLRFRTNADAAGRAAIALFAFALLILPLIGPLAGREWSHAEVFGIAPDPTAVATLGLVVAARGRVRWELLAIPLAWCIVGGATLWAMDAPDAVILPAAALVAAIFAAMRLREKPRDIQR